MIWFRIKDLENRIINNQLSDRDCLIYLLIPSSITTVLLTVHRQSGDYNNNWIVLIEVINYVAITIWGVFLTFKTNSLGDGLDYFKRFVAIQFVCTVRVIILFMPGLILLFCIWNMLLGTDNFKIFQNSVTYVWIMLVLGMIIKISLYLMINNSFKRLYK